MGREKQAQLEKVIIYRLYKQSQLPGDLRSIYVIFKIEMHTLTLFQYNLINSKTVPLFIN